MPEGFFDASMLANGGRIDRNAVPIFFETRYFFRGDFKPVDGRKVTDMLFLVSSRRGKTIVSPGVKPSFDMLPEVQHG